MWVYKIAKIQCVPALTQMFQTNLMGIWESKLGFQRPPTDADQGLCDIVYVDSREMIALTLVYTKTDSSNKYM